MNKFLQIILLAGLLLTDLFAKTPPPKARKEEARQKEDAVAQRQKAEMAESLGRHKNTGQKDHKGAR